MILHRFTRHSGSPSADKQDALSSPAKWSEAKRSGGGGPREARWRGRAKIEAGLRRKSISERRRTIVRLSSRTQFVKPPPPPLARCARSGGPPPPLRASRFAGEDKRAFSLLQNERIKTHPALSRRRCGLLPCAAARWARRHGAYLYSGRNAFPAPRPRACGPRTSLLLPFADRPYYKVRVRPAFG